MGVGAKLEYRVIWSESEDSLNVMIAEDMKLSVDFYVMSAQL